MSRTSSQTFPETAAKAVAVVQNGDVSDFQDVVHGEDLQFLHPLQQHEEPPAPMPSQTTAGSPPRWLAHLSTSQLVTISGAASGFLAGIVVCPLDVIKTRLQAQGAARTAAQEVGAKVSANALSSAPGFKSTVDSIFKNEGIKGFYRGLVPTMIGYLPTWTIYFTVYEKTKQIYPRFNEEYLHINYESFNHFCSALTAGLASSIAVNPVWVVKTRLMIQTNDRKQFPNRTYYNGTVDAFRKMYREEGIRVFYSGLVPSMFGLIHVGIHFPVYEKLKKVLRVTNHKSHEKELSLGRLILALAASKMIASTITYPHEILRTRMQIQSNAVQNCEGHMGLVDTVKLIFKKEGIKGFYAGYIVNLSRTVPASAVTLVSFEYFKNYLLTICGKV